VSTVLVVTNEQDLAVDLVVLELQRRGLEVLRCNTETLPEWRVVVEPGQRWLVRDSLGRVADSSGTVGVLWRRPEPPAGPASLTGDSQRQAFIDQWQATIEALASVPGPRWISRPAAIRAAEDKARQLAVARRVGFRVPATLWTNDLDTARAADAGEGVVVKAVTAACWEDDAGPAFVFAHRLQVTELPGERAFGQIPAAVQQPVSPKQDVRVTVIGERALAGHAVSSDESHLDWRLDDGCRWEPDELAPADADRCVRLTRKLDLRFGGIDLLRDQQGKTWFLEINPNGEWGWLNQNAGLPIVEALCDELTIGRGRG
jgi:hypothetical protein